MTMLDTLPDELLVRFIDLLGRRDLAKVRLLNKRLCQISTAELFQTVTLYPQWQKDDEKDERHSVDSEQDEGWTWAGADEPPQIEDMAWTGLEDGEREASRLFESTASRCSLSDAEVEDDLATDEVMSPDRSVVEMVDTGNLEEEDTFIPASGQSSPRVRPSNTRSISLPLSHYGDRMPRWAVDRLPGPPGYNARTFKDIMLHETLRNYVKEVEIYTCEPHCDHHPVYSYKWFEGAWPQPTYHREYHDCIRQLGLFPNVHGVTVHFDRHAGEDGDDNLFQDPDYQRLWLRRILSPLGGRVKKLALRHFENTGDKGVQSRSETPELLSTMSGVKSFRLSVKHRETSADSGPMYKSTNIHPFWNSFADRFLRPMQHSLTKLVLYSDLPIGWFPKLDLRPVHLPILRSLTLGHHVFYRSHQIDWILSHSSSLKELNLDRCAVLYQIGHSIKNWLDDEGYPIGKDPHNIGYLDYGWSTLPNSNREPRPNFVSSNLRWHDVFGRFAQALKKLRTFRFGESVQWNFDGPSHFEETDTPGYPLPTMPWNDEHHILPCTMQFCYRIWDDWDQQYRYDWKRSDRTYYSADHSWRDDWTVEFEPPPDCLQQDEDALEALLDTVRYN